MDLLCWRDARPHRGEIFYWRTPVGEEVDKEYPDRCAGALLLHTGRRIEWLAGTVPAVPWWRVC